MFETYIYQPFFNILVGLYWLLGQISPDLADMGIAVILFSIVVQILLFPLRLAGERSEDEKKAIVQKVEEIKKLYAHEPIRQKYEIKKVLRGNARIVISTAINILIQLGLILMLYRLFKTGLEGADFHLLYSFIPRIDHINLVFLGKYDLSQTNNILNIIQSVMIFVVELLGALRTTSMLRKKEIALLQIILPLGSYFIFMLLPSGKKLFVITALAFTASYQVFRILQEAVARLNESLHPQPSELAEASPLTESSPNPPQTLA